MMAVSADLKGDGIWLDLTRAGYVGPQQCRDAGQHPIPLSVLFQ